jgi:transcriptional regulator with XRE-family HTH domain
MATEVKTTKGGVVHRQVENVLSKVGMDISYARRVRRISADDFAKRVGISRATLHRLEKGDPGISLNTLAMALQALGRLETLRDIVDPAKDDVAIMQMRAQAPKRIGKPRTVRPALDLGEGKTSGEGAEKPQSKYVGF